MSDQRDAKIFESHLSAHNQLYLESMYRQFLSDPMLVDERWRKYFENGFGKTKDDTSSTLSSPHQSSEIGRMVYAYRNFGYLTSHLNPLNAQAVNPELFDQLLEDVQQSSESSVYKNLLNGISDNDVDKVENRLKEIYSQNIAYEYQHIVDLKKRTWLQDYIEDPNRDDWIDQSVKHQALRDLIAAEGLEKYIGSKYIGQKRFSS